MPGTKKPDLSEKSHQHVIDIWANYWPSELFSAYPKLDQLYTKVGLQSRTRLGLHELVEEAESVGVGTILLSSAEFPGSPITNDVLSDEISQYPSTLLGCGSVDPRRPDAAEEVYRCVHELGFRAIKVVPFFSGIAPDDSAFDSIYLACENLEVPVLILTGHTAVMEPSRFGQPLRIDEIALRFPGLKIVAGHAGYPWTEELISVAWKHDNVFIDTSGHRPRYWPQSLIHYLSTYGSQRVMFGSGFPMLPYGRLLQDLDELHIPDESRTALLGGNARRLLSLGTS